MSALAPATGPSLEFRITYEASLVEEGVLLAEKLLPAARAAAFRSERDRIYEVRDRDEREARFEELHGRFFVQLALDRPLHEALSERPELMRRTRACRVLPATSRREEGADLRAEVDAGAAGALPTIVLRLCPSSLLQGEPLLTLLRRELLHVADMVDPAFGYRPELPLVHDDPAILGLVRERYRVVWGLTVDGTLYRARRAGLRARGERFADFLRTFPALGGGAEAAFATWFDGPRPTHEAILEFVLQTLGPATAAMDRMIQGRPAVGGVDSRPPSKG
jgi:hypothetical protein